MGSSAALGDTKLLGVGAPATRPSDAATSVVLAATAVRVALALSTDLSPDEAYYLCAARRPELVPPIPDHPPLLPWLLRLTDGLPLPLELRVRIWPLVLSTLLGLCVVELARRRGANRSSTMAAAWLGSWSLLPMAGFIATPDAPALLACAALLWWSTPQATGSTGSFPRDPSIPARRDYDSRAIAIGAGAAALLGTLAKVVVAPVAALAAIGARGPLAARSTVALLPWVALPWLCASLHFQARHALVGPTVGSWRPLEALGAAGAALLAQLALWSPWVVLVGVGSCFRPLATRGREPGPTSFPRAPPPHAWVVVLFTLLMVTSALARAVPPEPNWWAPAALVVVVNAALYAGQLAPARRIAMLAMAVVPTAIAATHVMRPWLPLPVAGDPSARLHGWSAGQPPIAAPGVGAYGPAAERCIYRSDCDEILLYFNRLNPK